VKVRILDAANVRNWRDAAVIAVAAYAFSLAGACADLTAIA
jgi:hypothetical protein